MRFDSVILIKIRRQARIKCVCRFCGNVPLQVPPLMLLQYSAEVGETAGSNKAIIVDKRSRWQAVTAFCGNEPLQIPPAAVSHFKFAY